jgi:hypothetical protein
MNAVSDNKISTNHFKYHCYPLVFLYRSSGATEALHGAGKYDDIGNSNETDQCRRFWSSCINVSFKADRVVQSLMQEPMAVELECLHPSGRPFISPDDELM